MEKPTINHKPVAVFGTRGEVFILKIFIVQYRIAGCERYAVVCMVGHNVRSNIMFVIIRSVNGYWAIGTCCLVGSI